jgi:hypothetical protein
MKHEASMTNNHVVKIDLHPMHLQVIANLALLKAAKPSDETAKAIKALEKVKAALVDACGGMGVKATFS